MTSKLLVCLLGTSMALIAVDGLRVAPDAQNVVSSRLEGEWVKHVDLSARLWGNEQTPSTEPLVFRSDPSVASKVPEQYQAFIGEGQVFMAGTMTKRGTEHPFLLIQLHGNPYVLYFRESDGDPFGDAESFNLVVAPAKATANDLLFIGGDFNNQPFTAYERKSK